MARWYVPAGLFALLLVSALGDHYFRDEFYYLACSHRLDWGYVDHPPLCVALLWAVRHVAGDSLLALRTAAALLGALTVWTTGSIARRLGAGAYGEALAMAAAGLAPALLATASFYSMNVIDVFAWTLAGRVLVDILERPTTGRWIALGVVFGLGLENKISVLWLAAGLGVGLALTPARRLLLTPGPWAAGAIAALLFAPNVGWEIAHGWPTLEFIRNASAQKMHANTPLAFLAGQVIDMNPLLLPVWLGGLLFLLFSARLARFRALAIAFLAVAAILMANRTSRGSYLAPAYPMLFAAGGIAIEQLTTSRAVRGALLTVAIAAGAMSVPLAIPILPTDNYVRYSRALGIAPSTEEKKDVGRLPQFFADREGWQRMVDQIGAVYDRLPAPERALAAVLVGNYGEAGAIELLGRSRGMVVISGHNNYWLWGPQGRTGAILIVVSRSREQQEQRFTSVEQAGEIDCGDCMPYENRQMIFIDRGLKPPLQEQWPQFKHYE